MAPNHFSLALYYQRVGDFDNALTHYRALLEQNDASAEAHNNLGLLYQDRGQLDDAVEQFQRAIAIDAAVREGAQQPRRRAACGSNRPDAAAAEFRVALAAEPRNVESLVNLALVQKAAGRTADARDLLRRARRDRSAQRRLALQPRRASPTRAATRRPRSSTTARFCGIGAVTHADLVARVRARLAALAADRRRRARA